MPQDKEDKKGSYQPPTLKMIKRTSAWPLDATGRVFPPSIPRPRRRVGAVAKPGVIQEPVSTRRRTSRDRPEGHGTTEAERRAHRKAGGGPNLSPPKSMPLAEIRERSLRRSRVSTGHYEPRESGGTGGTRALHGRRPSREARRRGRAPGSR